VQAYRSNGRTAVDSSQLAEALWQNTGLKDVFSGFRVAGKEACGLNPNIRFYK